MDGAASWREESLLNFKKRDFPRIINILYRILRAVEESSDMRMTGTILASRSKICSYLSMALLQDE